MEKNRVIHFQIRKNIKKLTILESKNEDLAKSSFTQIIQFDYLRKSFIATFSILILNHHLNMGLLSVKDEFEESLSYIKSGGYDMTISFYSALIWPPPMVMQHFWWLKKNFSDNEKFRVERTCAIIHVEPRQRFISSGSFPDLCGTEQSFDLPVLKRLAPTS